MTPGHLAVLVLAAIGFCEALKWFALFAFWASGTVAWRAWAWIWFAAFALTIAGLLVVLVGAE